MRRWEKIGHLAVLEEIAKHLAEIDVVEQYLE